MKWLLHRGFAQRSGAVAATTTSCASRLSAAFHPRSDAPTSSQQDGRSAGAAAFCRMICQNGLSVNYATTCRSVGAADSF